MAEIIHFERRKMVLVKIPVIVLYMEQTKVSGADAVKPSELKERKGKFLENQAGFFLILVWISSKLSFLHSYTN